tara:strand:+ start:34 stop:534 length:501 start_codon:yes stop_codon:yes gene_type:complete
MDTKKILKYDLFNNFSEEELAPLLKVMHNQSFEADETIISENDSGDSIMLLLDGTVSVSKALTMKMNQSLKREKEFTKLTASEKPFFGEISIFNDNKRTATIKAETTCEIGIFYNKDIIKICNNNHEVGYKIMTNISKKLIDDLLLTNEQVLKLTTAFSLIIDKHI